MTIERNVKVRIDLAVDNPIAFMDEIQKRTEAVEASHKRIQQMASSGVLSTLMDKEIKLMETNAKRDRERHLNSMPVVEAKRRLELEEQIWKARIGRPYDVEHMVRQESLAREQEETKRQARYKAKFGFMAGTAGVMDRFTMGPLGYASLGVGMLGAVRSAGGGAYDTFSGAARRASGEIGIMLIPAVFKLTTAFHNLGTWLRELDPTVKSLVGNLAMYGLGASVAAKLFMSGVKGLMGLGMSGQMAFGGMAATTVGALGLAAYHKWAPTHSIQDVASQRQTSLTQTESQLRMERDIIRAMEEANGTSWNTSAQRYQLVHNAISQNLMRDIPPGTSGIELAAAIGRANEEASRRLEPHSRWVFGGRTLDIQGVNLFSAFGNTSTEEQNRRFAGALATNTANPNAPNAMPPPLSIPGFQSQQMDIFALKDQIQMEAMRDPSQQADFEQSVRSFETLLAKWNQWFEDNGIVGMPAAMGDMRIN